MRLRREVEVDWDRASGDRVPIRTAGRATFEFNEPAVAVGGGRPRTGVIGWDPSLGWVLVLDPVEERGSSPHGGPASA